MSKITIVTPKENIDNLLKAVIKSKLLHLSQIESNLYLNDIQEINLKKDELHFLFTSYQDLDRFFSSHNFSEPSEEELKNNIPQNDAKDYLLRIQERQTRWKQEIALVDQNENILQQYENIINNFRQIIPNLSTESDLQVRGILITNPTADLQNFLDKSLMTKTGGNYHLQLHQISSKLTIGSITYPKLYDKVMNEILEKLSITDLFLPTNIPGKTIGDKIRNFESQVAFNKERKKKLQNELHILFENYLFLTEHKQFIYESYYKLEGIKYIKVSEYFAFLEAFIPTKKINLLESFLDAQLQSSYSIDVQELKSNAPVKISNIRGVREFEVFTGMIQPIAYNTIDPTLFMAIAFPLFYGFIIGDIGYGFIISIIGLFLYKKFYNSDPESKGISNLGWVFFVSGLSSIFFGLLFGEFFGNFGEVIGLRPLLYYRSENILELLIISIAVGIIHVMFGFLLGIINAKRINDRHRFGSNLGYFITNSGFIFLILSFVEFPGSYFFHGSIIIILVGVLILIKFEGIISLIELISYIGNMLSYSRLMALGIASVILADIANNFYFLVGGGILGIFIAVLMHGLNIAIAMFSPLIHSMRLHLVEFFSKFVFDGTEQYHPFGESIGK